MLALTERAEIHDKLLPGGSTKSSLWYPSTWISSLCCSAGMRKKWIQLRTVIFTFLGLMVIMQQWRFTLQHHIPWLYSWHYVIFHSIKKMKRSLTKAAVNIVTMQLRNALTQPACGSISIDAMQSWCNLMHLIKNWFCKHACKFCAGIQQFTSLQIKLPLSIEHLIKYSISSSSIDVLIHADLSEGCSISCTYLALRISRDGY